MTQTELADREAATELAEVLGKLPLALEQARAYMQRTGCSPEAYLLLFESRLKLVQRGGALTGMQATLATTLGISLQQVKKTSPAGPDLVKLCAFFAPEDIPLDDIRRRTQHLPNPLATAMADQKTFEEAVRTLRRYSLVDVLGNSFLSIHRSVQAVVRRQMSEYERKKWAKAAVRVMDDAFPPKCDDWRTWPVCSMLLPHSKETMRHARDLQVDPEATGRLLNHLGIYSIGRGEFAEAKAAFEQALAIDKAVYGEDDPTVARDLTNLGFLLKDQGELEKAQKHFERALRINESAYGADHPEVATSLNNLGIVLKDQGQQKKKLNWKKHENSSSARWRLTRRPPVKTIPKSPGI
jgi:Tfp pilus assembly protein PilF